MGFLKFMQHVLFRCIFFSIFTFILSQVGFSQGEYVVPRTGTVIDTLCSGILRDSGGTGNYESNSNGVFTIFPEVSTCRIQLEGRYNTELNKDIITIFDGASPSGTILRRHSGSGSINVISTTGPITIRFRSDASSNLSGFEFVVRCVGGCECGGAPMGVTANVTSEGLEVNWEETTDSTVVGYFVEFGPTGFTPGTGIVTYVTENHTILTGLSTYINYDILVYFDCGNDHQLTTENYNSVTACMPETSPCFDFSQLNNSHITCTYGTFSNPYQNTGIVDYGENSDLSRHTIHRTPATDPRTEGYLDVIPPCELYSVRLGNWKTGAQAESISYDYLVDSATADILLLKYAAVLEDPSHSTVEQPRFTFDILNQAGNVIDRICGAADFIANPSLGWNSANNGNVLWKDWTNVGIDVSGYHGQTIRIRMTTYDCSQSGHYGYAYFTLNCKKRTIIAETCGAATANTYTAPSGFAYRWYYESTPGSTISTAQTVSINTADEGENLCCYCSFIGNNNCGFELKVALNPRYPIADFEAIRDSCSYVYRFDNQSSISPDGVTPGTSGEPCEGTYWDFGDGTTSTEENPVHDFGGPGTYNVQLISTLSFDRCQDTIVKTITILDYDPAITGDSTICQGESTTLTATGGDSYIWIHEEDTLSTETSLMVAPDSTTTYTLISITDDGCHIPLQRTVVVHDTLHVYIVDSICQGEAYSINGFSINPINAPGTIERTNIDPSQHGCDSTTTLNLTIKPLPNTSLGKDRVHCFADDGPLSLLIPEENCDSYLWSTMDTTQLIHVEHEGTYTATAILNGCSNESSIHITDKCAFNVYLPNCITPSNADGINDLFYLPYSPDIQSCNISIYDRWGRIIFNSSDIHFQWDGTINGQIFPNSVYTYRIEIRSITNEQILLKGTITVL